MIWTVKMKKLRRTVRIWTRRMTKKMRMRRCSVVMISNQRASLCQMVISLSASTTSVRMMEKMRPRSYKRSKVVGKD